MVTLTSSHDKSQRFFRAGIRVTTLCCCFSLFYCGLVHGDIQNWQTGETIPGTEGITPGPGIDLSGRNTELLNLRFADLDSTNLQAARFRQSWLDNARFTQADLSNASLSQTRLPGADFTGAIVTGADFLRTTEIGFTKEQFYSTASYGNKNLQGISLRGNDMTAWNLSDQNLTDADLSFGTTLTDADLSGANLTNAFLQNSTVSNADFTGATIVGADLDDVTGFTLDQLYSTASYQNKNLEGVGLVRANLTSADFSGQNLTNAELSRTTLTDANLTGAVVRATGFFETTSRGFTKEQLYSTASYQSMDLREIGLGSNNLAAWDFSGQNLVNAFLSNATLTDTNLTGAIVNGTRFDETTDSGFTKEQLYSTASYQNKNLIGIRLGDNDLTGWDFSGQNLANAGLFRTTLTDVNLDGAFVTGANIRETTSSGFTKEQLYSTASYQSKNLHGIVLIGNDMADWDFSGQNLNVGRLMSTNMQSADLTEASLADANLSRADLRGAIGFNPVATTNTEGMIWPDSQIRGPLDLRAEDIVIRPWKPDNGEVTVTGGLTAFAATLELVHEFGPDASLNTSTLIFPPGTSVELIGLTTLLVSGPTLDPGTTLNLFDWPEPLAPGNVFTEIELPPGEWDLSQLYTTGEITSVPESSTDLLLLVATTLGFGLGRLRKRGGRLS